MKKYLVLATSILLVALMLIGCGIVPSTPTSVPENPTGNNGGTPTEETNAAPTEPAPTETEDDVEYEGDATSYYIDVVYPEQIDRYYNALFQQWDAETYMENDMSAMAAYYYDGNPLDNVGFTFMDLDGDGIWELIIGAILNAERDPLIFEIWGLKDDEPVLLAQSNSDNRYYLQYAQEDNLWSVAYEAENGAANFAVYYLQLVNGEFEVIQGVIFDAMADEKNPWFMAYDLDWDTSNDTPIDEETANAVRNAGRDIYTATEYFPYCLYK